MLRAARARRFDDRRGDPRRRQGRRPPAARPRTNGEIVVALLEDSATVKRFQKTGKQVWLLPENPAYQPIDGNEAQILGKVKAVIRTY